MTLPKAAEALGARPPLPRGAGSVLGVSTDSRSVRRGDLFFALRGERFDGHQFVPRAVGKGAVAAVVEEGRAEDVPPWCRRRLLRVDDTRKALLRLAAAHRRRLSAVVVAVTGSCGKTTTKDLIACLLSSEMRGTASPKSFNNDVGVPLTLFDVEEHHDFAVVELGANAPGEIAELASVVRPHIGVITCIRPVHLEGFGSLWGVARAKAELVSALPPGGVFVFHPEETGMLAAAARFPGGRVTFGALPTALWRLEGLRTGQTSMHLTARGRSYRVPLLGAHNAMNVLAALAVGDLLGVSEERMADALRRFEGPQGRMKRRELGEITLLDDAYNANPASVLSALQTFGDLPVRGRRVVVLGDMMELGPRSVDFHISVGRAAAELRPDLAVTVGPLSGATAGALAACGLGPDRVLHFDDTGEAAASLGALLRPGDTVLLKASRRMAFERIRRAVEDLWSASRRLHYAHARS